MTADKNNVRDHSDYPVWIGADEDGRDIILDSGTKGLFLRVCRTEDDHLLPDGVPPPRTLEQAKTLIEEGRQRRRRMASVDVETEDVAIRSQVIAQPNSLTNELLVLDITPRELHGNCFRLWLPESVSTKEWNQALNTQMQWEVVNAGKALRGSALPGPPIKLDMEIDIHADHLDFRLLVQNNSQTVQEDIETNVCLQLAGAPGFRDQDGSRMFVWIRDELQCINNVGTPAKTHLRFHTEKSCFTSVEDSDTGFAFIGVRSISGIPMAIAWESHHGYLSNTSVRMCCMHANPILERLEPGQSKTVHGLLAWRGESLDALCCQARDKLASGNA